MNSDNEAMTSPSVKDVPTGSMDFNGAVQAMLSGQKITKLEWNNGDYGFLKSEILHINRNGTDHKWILSEADLVGEDYVVLAEEIK